MQFHASKHLQQQPLQSAYAAVVTGGGGSGMW
jgi:hypothetical protein